MPAPSSLAYAHPLASATHTPSSVRGETPSPKKSSEGFWGEDGFTFGDILDVLNPLQHIPVISTFYRSVTGDEVSIGARVFGGALFGGPLGLFAAAFDNAVRDLSGMTMGEYALAALDGSGDTTPPNSPKAPVVRVAKTEPEENVATVAAPAPSSAQAANGTIDPSLAPRLIPATSVLDASHLDIILQAAYGRREVPNEDAMREMSKALEQYEFRARLGVHSTAKPLVVDAQF